MARTPDRRPGESDEEGIILENRAPGDDPTIVGGIRYVDGAFRLKDAIGVYDPRFALSAAGSTGEVQFNDSGILSGTYLFTFNKLTSTLSVPNISGSLTRLTDGTSYLIAGNNVTIVTGSNGSITISSTATGGGGGSGDPNAQYLVLATTSSLNAERAFVPSTGLVATDGGANGNYTVSINDSIVATVSGTTFTGVTKHNAGLSGSLTQLTDGTSYLIAGNNISISTGSSGNVTIAATGLAPNTSQFLTLALDGNLSGERVFTPGTGLQGTDAGANGNYTLAINDSVVATVSGTTFTGVTKHNSGLSGSLTRLVDGTSYLIAGTNISITTGSSGAVTIANSAPIFYQWNELSPTPRLNTTASVSIAGALGSSYAAQSSGTDVFFFVSGSSGTSSGVSVFGGDVMVSGTLETQTITNFSTTSTTAALSINGSTRGTTTTGRGVTVAGAAGGGGLSGGSILIDAGDGSGTSSTGGSITINAGDSTTVSNPGSVSISAGTTTSTGGTAVAGSVTVSAGGVPAGGTGTAGSISLTTGNAANASSTPGNITFTSQRGKVILRQSTASVTTGTDVFLFVTGTVGDSNKSVFAGDMIVSGTVRSFTGFSGSHTQLTDGTSYLIAGSNVTISTGSSGAVTISAPSLAPSTSAFVTIGNDSNLSNERALATGTGLLAVDGGANSTYTLSIDNSVVSTISGSTFTGAVKFNGGLSGSLTKLVDGTSYLIAGSNVTIVTGSSGNVTVSTTGLAPNSSQFLTLALDSNLSEERVFTPGTGLLGTDAGANGNYTLSINDSVVATVSGTTFTGLVKVAGGISGSITSSNVSAGQVVVAGTGGVLSGSNNFFWDNSTGNIGIGTSSFTARLFVSGASTASTSTVVVREGVSSPTAGAMTLDVQNSAGTSLMVVSGSGFVGIGTTTTITSNKVSIFGATAPDTFAGHILLSSNTASSAANNGGQLNFQMYDGSSLRGSAFIKGAKENSTANNYSTYLSFGTRNNGDAAITERMRIDSGGSVQIGLVAETYANIARVFISGSSNTAASALVVREGALSALAGATVMSVYNKAGSQIFYVTGSGNVGIDNGNLVIGTAGRGIDFSITTNSSGSVDSELLDDYERGTWTPTIATGGGSVTLNATQTKGVYVKIGRMVWIGGHIRSSSVSSPSGVTVISGLPFTIDTWNAGQPAYMSFLGEWFSATGLGTNFAHAGGSLFQGLNSIEMFRYTTAGAFSSATGGNWDGSCEFSFTFCYNANV